jgi:hypothetical protein
VPLLVADVTQVGGDPAAPDVEVVEPVLRQGPRRALIFQCGPFSLELTLLRREGVQFLLNEGRHVANIRVSQPADEVALLARALRHPTVDGVEVRLHRVRYH